MNPQPDRPNPKPIFGFVAGTPILTPAGRNPIEELRPGDVIQGTPEEDHDDLPEGQGFK